MVLRNMMESPDGELPAILFAISIALVNLIAIFLIFNKKIVSKVLLSIIIPIVSIVLIYLSTKIEFLNNLYTLTNQNLTFALIAFTNVFFIELVFLFFDNKTIS